MTRRRIELAGHPEIAARVHMRPFQFEISGRGAVELGLGDVHLRFDEVPLRLRVPFMRHRVLVGSVGPFGVRMSPVDARIRAAEMVTQGVIGGEESGVDLRLDGACRASIKVEDEPCEEGGE